MTDNSDKIILDLCGGTGAWSKPYVDAGYDVRLITMADDYDVRRWRTIPDVVEPVEAGNVYGILAAPPCTQFSRARTTAKTERDLKGAMEIVDACLDIVKQSRINGRLQFWALENPMSMLRQILGNPPHHFRGWEWGDKHVKFTDLWGYYNMPPKKILIQPKFNRKTWASPRPPAAYANMGLSRADIRAITPAGFAQAFFKANP